MVGWSGGSGARARSAMQAERRRRGHRAARVGAEIRPRRRRRGAEVAVRKPIGRGAKRQRHGAAPRGVAEGKDGFRGRPAGEGSEVGESLLAQRAGVADALDRKHLLVDAGTRGPQLRQGFQGLLGLEVGRVIDRGLGPERAFLLEILLDVGVLVGDVQAGGDARGDDAAPVAGRRGRREAGVRLGNSRLCDPGGRDRVLTRTASTKDDPGLVAQTWVRDFRSCQSSDDAGTTASGRRESGNRATAPAVEVPHTSAGTAHTDRLEADQDRRRPGAVRAGEAVPIGRACCLGPLGAVEQPAPGAADTSRPSRRPAQSRSST